MDRSVNSRPGYIVVGFNWARKDVEVEEERKPAVRSLGQPSVNKPTVLLLNESQLISEQFVEAIIALLNGIPKPISTR